MDTATALSPAARLALVKSLAPTFSRTVTYEVLEATLTDDAFVTYADERHSFLAALTDDRADAGVSTSISADDELAAHEAGIEAIVEHLLERSHVDSVLASLAARGVE